MPPVYRSVHKADVSGSLSPESTTLFNLPLLYSFFFCTVYSTAILLFFFFNDTATTEIYTLSLHDALPIYPSRLQARPDQAVLPQAGRRPVAGDGRGLSGITRRAAPGDRCAEAGRGALRRDRKSTRLNSSHT